MNEQRLLDLREDHDLYQKDIARIIGVNRKTYSSWETGFKIIPLKHLNKLCNYYDVSMDYALGLSKTNHNANIKKIDCLSKVDIGKSIKYIRETNKLTLRKLADELKTTSSTISAYEHGKTLILTAFAFQICKKYNYSLDKLCCRIK